MAALTAPRNIPRLGETSQLDVFKFPIAANVRIFPGAGLALNASGQVAPAVTATTLKSAGVAEREYNNLGGAAGALTVEARAGVFPFVNSSAGDAIVQADVGADCFWVDDQTVAKTNGTSTRSVAGKVVSVSEGDSLVYVRVSLT